MTNDDPTRQMENFRHRTLAELERRLAARDLARPEYERRVGVALRATSPGELKPLISDWSVAGAAQSPPAVAPPSAPAAVAAEAASGERDFVLALMSGGVRKGSWEPPDEITAVAIMGGVLLDFRDAALLEGRTRVHAFALMGGVKIIVPPDIHVAVRGFGFMGGFSHLRRTAPDAGAPLIDIDGLAVMGGVEVKVLGVDEQDPDEDGGE